MKFSLSEMPQNTKHTLGTQWRNMLVHCHKTLADTIDCVVIAKTFASTMNKRRGILESSSKCWLICLKQEATYIAGWCGSFFYLHSLPPPHSPMEGYPMWGTDMSVCSFCCQHHRRLHARGPKWVSGGDGGYKCQLSVNSIQTLQNVVGVLKKRGRLLFLICGGGGGEWGGSEKNGIQPPTFCFTLLPLLYSVTV